jgi:parallel beta-helix repeat protein
MKKSILSSMARYAQGSQCGRRAAKSAAKDGRNNRRRTLHLERLEDRTVPSTFTVTNTLDDGSAGSLRWAITQANATANVGGPDVIAFNIPGTGIHTISPTSQLPDITDPVILDGYTQPGASVNTNGPGLGDNAVLQIELNGSLAGSSSYGLRITAGGSTIRGLAINRFGTDGVVLTTVDGNTVSGNFIGTDPTGMIGEGNTQDGVHIGGSNGNTVGGLTADARNVISGNGNTGIHIEPSNNNTIVGNFIGTDVTGKNGLSSATSIAGVLIFACNNNTVGGATPNARNIISGNSGGFGGYGVEVGGFGTGNQVLGNCIGTDVTGESAVPNVNGVFENAANTVSNNVISGNHDITGNTGFGLRLLGGTATGNYIGTDQSGTQALGNVVGVQMGSATLGGTGGAADRNVISGNTNGGVAAGSYSIILGNYIGTDVSGTLALGNLAPGIQVFYSNNVTIGGTSASARNVIAGNSPIGGFADIDILGSTNILIQGNYVGVDKSGDVPLSSLANSSVGILVRQNSSYVTIGGTSTGAGNVLGSRDSLIAISGGANYNTVQGNSLGVGADGITPLSSNAGVRILATTNNLIGGTASGAGNTIANSAGDGVFVQSAGGNSILGNSIHNNGGLGIHLDSSGNNNQAAPVLTTAASAGSGATINGTLASVANTSFRIEFFSNSSPNPSGFGEGLTFLGFATVTTDSSGNATFTASLAASVPVGQRYLSATATNLTTNDTSQFAKDLFLPFNFSGFLPPLSNNLSFNQKRSIPIKWQLTDTNGQLITSLSATTSLQVAPVLSGGGLGTPFNPTPAGGTVLRNDGTQYIFNWDTKNVAVGAYEILLTLADGTVQTKTLQIVTKGGSNGLVVNGTSGTTATVGGLLGGDITLYVDNTNGDLTADELARIQDAVTAAVAVTEPYGVAVTEVTDPTLADVTLNMDTTSAVGGYADGVLGCTTDAGQITLINGWNFYAGSDATQIGAGQYDFETVVEHELGHALGLGHSTDSTSVMYATLNAGTVNRTLTTADLNVADTDTTGACGLHATIAQLAFATGARTDTLAGARANLDNASAIGDTRGQLLLAMLGSEWKQGAGVEAFAPSVAAHNAVFSSFGTTWIPDQQKAQSASTDPIFAGLTPDKDEAWLEAPLFPDPSQAGRPDAEALESVHAGTADRTETGLPTQLDWLDE